MAVRLVAGAAIAASVVVPLVRRRRRIPAPVTLAALAAGPLGIAVLRPRTPKRDVALYALQMWGFAIAHELPYDDPAALRRRLRIRYPIHSDRLLGGGELPTARLQRVLSRPGEATALDRVDRKSTRLNSSHTVISYAVFCLKKKKKIENLSHNQTNNPTQYQNK